MGTAASDDHVVGECVHRTCVLEDGSHQAVRRHQPRLILESHRVRNVVLLVSEQPVGRATGLQMERAPHPREELLGRIQLTTLGGPEQTVGLERTASDRLEPPERVDVAEPAAPLLQLRFQEVRGRTEALAPLPGVVGQPVGEHVRVGAQMGQHGIDGRAEQLCVSSQRSGVEHGGRGVKAIGRQRRHSRRTSSRRDRR